MNNVRFLGYLNLYQDLETRAWSGGIHTSREDADVAATKDRQACVEIPIDFDVGEGLDPAQPPRPRRQPKRPLLPLGSEIHFDTCWESPRGTRSGRVIAYDPSHTKYKVNILDWTGKPLPGQYTWVFPEVAASYTLLNCGNAKS